MNKKSFISIVALPALLLLSGCGSHKQVTLLKKLYMRMTKCDVIEKLGMPEIMLSPEINSNGDTVDVWQYKLATVNQSKKSRKITQQVCGWILFWPLLLFPSTWESYHEYSIYYVEFTNDTLSRWGHTVNPYNYKN